VFDFLKVTKEFRGGNNGRYYYKPTFIAKSSIKDLMTRGGEFYAIYDEETGFWTKSKPRAFELIDAQVREYAQNDMGVISGDRANGYVIQTIADASTHLFDLQM
jgi:hypothetical protein